MRLLLIACLAFTSATTAAHAQSVEDFYRGRTVNLVIGYSVGGGYDIHGRLLARHLGKHIPGNPGIIVQNMPGGGSLRSANFLYNAAPKDGSTIGIFSRGMAMEPLIGASNTQYDARKFTWLGSITNEASVCATSSMSKVKTWDDLQSEAKEHDDSAAASQAFDAYSAAEDYAHWLKRMVVLIKKVSIVNDSDEEIDKFIKGLKLSMKEAGKVYVDQGFTAVKFGWGVFGADPSLAEQYAAVRTHFEAMLEHYGQETGVRMARKHLGWYSKGLPASAECPIFCTTSSG